MQLSRRRAALERGARHLGWKVALGIPGAEELVGEAPLLGYLTSESVLPAGATFAADGVRHLQVDCELAVELGRDVTTARAEVVSDSIAAVATSLELCDVGRPPADFDTIVASNVFHRAVVFGDFTVANTFPSRGRVCVNRAVVAEASVLDPIPHVVGVARLLLAVGERLRSGDRIICGAICSAHPNPGDEVEVEVEVGELGRLVVAIA